MIRCEEPTAILTSARLVRTTEITIGRTLVKTAMCADPAKSTGSRSDSGPSDNVSQRPVHGVKIGRLFQCLARRSEPISRIN